MSQFTFSILTQQTSVDTPEQYSVLFNDLHTSVKALLEANDAESKKNLTDLVQKSVSSLRGGLSQFLSTPLKSDKEEIDRLIKDNFDNLLRQSGCSISSSEVQIGTYGFIDPQHVPLHRQVIGVMKRMLKNGKTVLSDSGVLTGKGAGNIFFSFFAFDNFSSLPVIQSAFVQALSQKNETQFTVINQSIASIVSQTKSDEPESKNIVLINFSSGDAAISRLETHSSVLHRQFGIKNIRLIRRSFDMGYGSPYQLQISLDVEKHALGNIIMTLVDDDADLENALMTEGSLIVLEKTA